LIVGTDTKDILIQENNFLCDFTFLPSCNTV
jgi:hypothetical protein